MESYIKIRATVPEMNAFFEEDGGVRFMEIRDKRYTQTDLERMPEAEYNSTRFLFFVIYRHRELEKELRGTFTIKGLKEKLAAAENADDNRRAIGWN